MYEYRCTVTRVVDGDTVDAEIDLGFDIVFKSRIRLFGVDTPESRTRDLDEKARGKLAKDFLSFCLASSDEHVIKTSVDGKGKFGRVLGEIYCDGKNINLLMIDKHHAVAYKGQSKDEIAAEHLVNRQILIAQEIYIPSK